MTDPVLYMPRRVRVLGALVAVLSIGMAALLFFMGHLASIVNANRAELQRQQQVTERLADALAAAQRDARAQRRLVRALQHQVRQLGGVPLTEPPPQQTPRGSAAGSTGSGPNAGSSPTPQPSRPSHPRPSPSSSPSPRPSHSPSPSSSPVACIPGVTCIRIPPLPGGVIVAFVRAW